MKNWRVGDFNSMEKDNALLETNDIGKVLERKSFKFVLKYLRVVVGYDFVSLKNKSFGEGSFGASRFYDL